MRKVPQSGPSPSLTSRQNYAMHETIAVVDDEQDILELVSLHLKKNHFSVREFSDGSSFIKYLDSEKPDLVISGINRGLNIGDDVTYSGTVAAALEAVLLGVPGVAVSADKNDDGWDFSVAARMAAAFADGVLERGLPPRVLLSVNVPRGQPNGVRVTVQGRRNHSTSVSERTDVRGRPYYWIGLSEDDWLADGNSDHRAIAEGFVSVTPLQTDLTAYDALDLSEELSRRSHAEVR